MKEQYVILTGSKNNAGDYLIKYRAKELFAKERKDRKIIDFNGWEAFTKEKLDVINESKALILMGGPALVENMVPRVYKLTQNLHDIKVPIIMMGIGWKSSKGDWQSTYNYNLNKQSKTLLDRINRSGFYSSVRDYQTLNAIRFHGFDKFLMTGCPAYYDYNFINKEFKVNVINKVSFSLGVAFINSLSMEQLVKENILACREKFTDQEFNVVFHHSLDREQYKQAYKFSSAHLKRYNRFADWLNQKNINFVDISGSAENLINHYSDVDLHVGYRVHAHIFMNSISKPSILIAEDGRAKGVKTAIGGVVLDSYLEFKEGFISKVLNRYSSYDRFSANNFLTKELISEIDYEKSIDFLRMRNARREIDSNYSIMQKFLKQLP